MSARRSTTPGARRAPLLAGTALAAVALLTASSAAAAGSAELQLDFDNGLDGAAVGSVANRGSAAYATRVVSQNGGTVVFSSSREAQGEAVRFPAHDASAGGARAVLVVSNTGGVDQLNPGTADFTWGADFAIDATSFTKDTGTHDNGDNLIQRGLSGTRHQFKLELDDHRPSCVLQNTAGGAFRITVPVTVAPDQWYRATCQRSGTALTVTLQHFTDQGAVDGTWSAVRRNASGFGAVSWTDPSVPLTVGGKLNPKSTAVNAASDQFNGSVDNVVVDIVG